MRNETTNTAVPKLRFPEFRGEPSWSEVKLAENLYEHRLKSDGKSEVHSVSVHKGVINQVEHLGRSFSAADTSKYSLAKPFDIIYTKSPTGDFPYGVVKQNLTGKNVIVSPLYGVFKPTNEYVGNLIHAYFEDPGRTSNYLVSLVQKGAKNTLQISNDRFLSKEIYLPTNEAEQQKIAVTLSSLDDLLTAQSAKLAALQAHKRGLMQGLFPAEGETVPKLRFPEFREAAEWEVKILGDYTLSSAFGPRFSSDLYSASGNVLTLRTTDINNDGFINYDSAPKALVDIDQLEGHLLLDGDLVVSRSGTIGVTGIFNGFKIPVLPGAFLIRFRLNRDCLSPNYIQQIFNSPKGRNDIEKLSAGGGQKNLSGSNLLKMKITIPSLAEQQKIAGCLSSLDNRINAQSQKIEALKLHKKGLMQGLFPAAAEPTA